jgi:hypothetical protein
VCGERPSSRGKSCAIWRLWLCHDGTNESLAGLPTSVSPYRRQQAINRLIEAQASSAVPASCHFPGPIRQPSATGQMPPATQTDPPTGTRCLAGAWHKGWQDLGAWWTDQDRGWEERKDIACDIGASSNRRQDPVHPNQGGNESSWQQTRTTGLLNSIHGTSTATLVVNAAGKVHKTIKSFSLLPQTPVAVCLSCPRNAPCQGAPDVAILNA